MNIPYNLYLGCPVKAWFEEEHGKYTVERKGKLSWNHENDEPWVIYQLDSSDEHDAFEETEFDFKLILRKLSSMTEEEALHCYNFCWAHNIEDYLKIEHIFACLDIEDVNYSSGSVVGNSLMFLWCLKNGFDLFQLIDSGLAIDRDSSPEI